MKILYSHYHLQFALLLALTSCLVQPDGPDFGAPEDFLFCNTETASDYIKDRMDDAGTYNADINFDFTNKNFTKCTITYCLQTGVTDCSSTCTPNTTASDTVTLTDGDSVCVSVNIKSDDVNKTINRWYKVSYPTTTPAITYNTQMQTRSVNNIYAIWSSIGESDTRMFMNLGGSDYSSGTKILRSTEADVDDGVDLSATSTYTTDTNGDAAIPPYSVDATNTSTTIQVEGYDVDQSWLDYGDNTLELYYVLDYELSGETPYSRSLNIRVYDFDLFQFVATGDPDDQFTAPPTAGSNNISYTIEGGFLASGVSYFESGLTESGEVSSTDTLSFSVRNISNDIHVIIVQ